MEEDSEVLDWGNEDDEVQTAESYRSALQQSGQEDVEDAVSLGGDEDDEIYPYKAAQSEDPSKTQQNALRSPQAAQPSTNARREGQRENSGTSQKPSSRQSDSSQVRRSQSVGHMTHALPPKPVVAPPPFIPPTSTQTSTIASAMVPRERRPNGPSKNLSGSRDRGSELPPDWEERYPRNGGRNPYYYNVRTHESTWTRPHLADPGLSSPSKDRGQDVRGGVDLSPRRRITGDDSRVPKKEDKRRASPGTSLTFEDRHYRPDGTALTNGSSAPNDKQDSHARPAGLPPRPPSPRAADRRPAHRSVTPPARRNARSLERTTLSRRDVSPPVDRGLLARGRRSPALDRDWDRSRTTVAAEDRDRSYTADSSTPRGRRLRDEPPPEYLRPDQDPRDASNPWSAPRPRSPPPPIRDQSPPRRYPEPEVYDRERPRTRGDRPATSPLSDKSRVTDPYDALDTVPQRRAREYDPEYGNDVKRRRVEDDPYGRPSPNRRSTLSPILDRATLHAPLQEPLSTRKRAPLPPQSDRFREVAKSKPVAEPLPAPYPPLRAVDSVPNSRNAADYPDAPSAPRGRNLAPPSREEDFDRLANSRSRFEAPLPLRDERGRDVMDVDYPPQVLRGGPPRGEVPSSRPRASSDRPSLDLQMDILPKGPRAMPRGNGSFSRTPPSPSHVLPSNPLPAGRAARAPPPHVRIDAESVSRELAPPSAPRGYSDFPEDRWGARSQEFAEPRSQDPPPRSARREEGARPGPKISGANNVPIGPKRNAPPNSAPVDLLLRLPPAAPDRAPSQYATEDYRAPPPRVAYAPDVDPTYDDRLAPYEERSRRSSVSGRGNPTPVLLSPQFNMLPPNSLPPQPRGDHPSGPGSRSGHQSRLAPDTPQAPPHDEPRIWLTREESWSLSRHPLKEALPGRGLRGYDDVREELIPRYDTQFDRHAPPLRGRDYDNIPQRAVSPPTARSSNGSDDTRMRDPPSLDRRSSRDGRMPQYDTPPDVRRPPPRARDDRGTSYDEDSPVMRDGWGPSRGVRDDRDSTRWDRPMDSTADRRYPHSNRARDVEHQPLPPREPSPYGRRTIPHRSGRDLPADMPYGALEDAGMDMRSQRPSLRRGPSLLDRLQLDEHPAAAPTPPPSLRERVDTSVKRTLPEVSGLPPRPSAETTYTAEMDALDAGRGRGRKRRVKPKRDTHDKP